MYFMKKKFVLSLIANTWFCLCFAQSNRLERNSFINNKITEKNSFQYIISKGQKLPVKVHIYSVTFSEKGFPLIQTRFKKDGSVSDKYVSEYKSDSLEIKMV